MTPSLSIIIPAHNTEKYLAQAIESVLNQTYTNWELIIIDDASTDTTSVIAEKYAAENPQIKYIRNDQNLGISKTRNKGIALAQGTYIAMLDSDDVWLDREKLALQIAALEQNPQLGLVGTWMKKIDEHGNKIGEIQFAQTDSEIRHSLLYRNHIAQSSVMFRKNAALELGGYDETLTTMEDHDLWLKIGSKYSLATLPIYALGYRVHTGGITKRRALRVALDELVVIIRHHNQYSGFIKGSTKGILRIARSLF
jgi:glycosyltransferase involved in cell wall biosynthesis